MFRKNNLNDKEEKYNKGKNNIISINDIYDETQKHAISFFSRNYSGVYFFLLLLALKKIKNDELLEKIKK